MAKIVRKPRDFSQRALSVVQQSTGQAPKQAPYLKNPTAVHSGKLGGLKGGRARAKRLSPQRRLEIARRAARSRWNKSS